MASSSQAVLSMFLLFLAASSCSQAVLATGDDAVAEAGNQQGLTHIQLYLHGTSSGPNATVAFVLASPLGANSSFGSMAVVDDELRDGPDRASSGLVGRFQGLLIGAALPPRSGYITSFTLVFTAGEYAGSTLSIQGPLLSFTDTIERAVVGGTGKFRLVRGYSLAKFFLSNPTPETGVFEIDLFLLMHPGVY